MRERVARLFLTLFLLSPVAAYAQGQTITAHWDANPPADQVTDYEVCVSTTSLSCNVHRTTVPASQTSFVFAPTPGILHFFTVRAISGKGKSKFPKEVQVSIPSFAQPAAQKNTINALISTLSLAVNDPDGGKLQYSHAGLPFGLTLNPNTGQITGAPTAAGTYNVTISVFDGLVTVFRSFVWTIGDVTPPTLVVTSHVSGQTVSLASATIRGTATDFGAGGSGVSSVTVNGQTATGGAATANGIANWNHNLTLSAGSNAITIQATDGAGNVRTTALTLNFGSSSGQTSSGGGSVSSMTGASLAASLSSPQPSGTSVTFTASGTGGTSPYQYQWYLQQNGGAFQLMRSWSTAATYLWTPTQPGTYVMSLWARSAGATANAFQAYAERTFVISGTSTTTTSGVIALDQFTGTNATSLTSHVPDVSPGTMWSQIQGASARLQNGAAVFGSSIGYTIATLETRAAGGTVAVDMTSGSSAPFAGLVFRVVDSNRMLLLRYAGSPSLGLLGLFRRVNGNFELIRQETTTAIARNTTHRLEARLTGNKVQAVWDNRVVFEETVSDYASATRHGLLWHSDDPLARLDNFTMVGAGGSSASTPSSNRTPVISGPSNQVHVTGASVSVPISATDPDGEAIQYGAAGLPSGLAVNAISGVISGVLSANAGVYNVTVTAADRVSIATRTFTWTVTTPAPTGPPPVSPPPVTPPPVTPPVSPAVPGQVVHDSFTGSNGSLITAHTADVSPGGAMWLAREGMAPRLQSGWLASGGSIGYTIATLSSGSAKGSVSVDLFSPSSTPFGGIVFRALDTNRMLLLRYAGNSSIGLLGLFRRVNGAFELIHQQTVAPMTASRGYRLEARFSGNRVQAFWDGAIVFEQAVNDYSTATHHGLLWHSDDSFARFDNFTVNTNKTP